ncbi:MAG: hypothetical protein IKU25_03670 [Clostridia bacterium]|nr:hypothetical protein [Clostridia bacterium]
MLISQSELFPIPSQITIEFDSKTLAGAKECNVITTCKEDFVHEYGENEAAATTLGAYTHYLQIESVDVHCSDDLSLLRGATVKIRMPKKTIVFSDCKTYKMKTKIVGDKECISEICMLSPHKTVKEA